MSKIVDPSCTLVGFDLSPAQFPDPSTLPANVSFQEHDLFQLLPESHWGKYDIVAARALCLAMNSGDYDRAVANFMVLLSKWPLMYLF